MGLTPKGESNTIKVIGTGDRSSTCIGTEGEKERGGIFRASSETEAQSTRKGRKEDGSEGWQKVRKVAEGPEPVWGHARCLGGGCQPAGTAWS
jgi:hypothetical protein